MLNSDWLKPPQEKKGNRPIQNKRVECGQRDRFQILIQLIFGGAGFVLDLTELIIDEK